MDKDLTIDHYDWFIKKIHFLLNVDLSKYKRPQMERRINSFMTRCGADNYYDFYHTLQRDGEIKQKFSNWITIHVSEFYRDLDRYVLLKETVLPYLVSTFSRLNIWSAGCSNGSEAYSISMLLREMNVRNYHITATDIDDKALAEAEKGVYGQSNLKNIAEETLRKYFSKCLGPKNEVVYKVNNDIKKNVSFRKHDLLNDAFENGFNFIACRNVVIYFTLSAKESIYKKFMESLTDKGIFFVGSTEGILDCDKYNLERISADFYVKNG